MLAIIKQFGCLLPPSVMVQPIFNACKGRRGVIQVTLEICAPPTEKLLRDPPSGWCIAGQITVWRQRKFNPIGENPFYFVFHD